MPTVLVVDDEPQIRAMMALVLEQEGYSVLTAESAPAAKSVWQSHPAGIDLVISDVVMPGTDGPTLAADLVTQDPAMPVLLMSGCCAAAIKTGQPFPFLAKPFTTSELLEKVRCLIAS